MSDFLRATNNSLQASKSGKKAKVVAAVPSWPELLKASNSLKKIHNAKPTWFSILGL